MNRIRQYVPIFLNIIFWTPAGALAQGPPVFGETPIMLGLEGSGIRTFGRYAVLKHSRVYTQPLAVPYNITAKWQAGVIVPFVYKAPKGADSRFGVGDIKGFTKYQLHQKDWKGKTFRSIIKLTESLPTGPSSGDVKLGAGAYQTALAIVTGYITLRYGIYAEAGYNAAGSGIPDHLFYNFAFGYPLLRHTYPIKQVNMYLEVNGKAGEDSNALFISPAIQYIAGPGVLIETGIQLPVVEDVPSEDSARFIYMLGLRALIY